MEAMPTISSPTEGQGYDTLRPVYDTVDYEETDELILSLLEDDWDLAKNGGPASIDGPRRDTSNPRPSIAKFPILANGDAKNAVLINPLVQSAHSLLECGDRSAGNSPVENSEAVTKVCPSKPLKDKKKTKKRKGTKTIAIRMPLCSHHCLRLHWKDSS